MTKTPQSAKTPKTKPRPTPLLQCRGLKKSYGAKTVLRGIDLEIPRGKIIGLLGPNGTGKTTLIKLATGLLTPTAGKLQIDGQNVGPATKRIVSYLPEQNSLDKTLTITQLIRYFSDFYDNFDPAKAEMLLKDLDLDTSSKLSHMSKGMQEKVQLCLAMSRQAELYILDEPLGGVDPATRDYILDTILANFSGGNSSLLISTHLISDIERILDEVVFIKNGRVFLTGDADELRAQHHASIDEIFRKEFKNV